MRVALLGFLSFALAFGQLSQLFNPFVGMKSPQEVVVKSGSWAKYRITSEEKKHSGDMKLSVVGDAECAGAKCVWFELELWDKLGNHDIMKYLMRGDISEGSKGYFSIIVKHNDQPAYELEFPIEFDTTSLKAQTKEASSGGKKASEAEKPSMEMNTEEVKVPAGTFKCTHVTMIDEKSGEKTDVWFSPEVPITGIVKLEGKDGYMELLEYGTEGAKSAITETPRKISIKDYFKEQLKESLKESAEESIERGLEKALEKGFKSLFGR